MTDPLFEVIDQEQFLESKRTTKEHATEPRTMTTWFKLPYRMGFCEVPEHDKIIQALSPERQEYRQRYPVRMVYPINGIPTCRDCFMVGKP